ncbi:putative transposase [Lyngbya sp. PCC 8106]|nr:putative transposase [Lyngbya sp. PCC 8106]
MKVSRPVLKPSQNGDISGLGQPTPEQENLLRRTLGCVRLVYNKALATRTEAWYERKERVGYSQTSSMLTSWKKEEELDFLNEVSCVPPSSMFKASANCFQ